MLRFPLLLCCILIASSTAFAQETNSTSTQQGTATARDGSHDFDFEDGTWKIHLKRRLHPLTGSNQWVEFDGDTTTQKLWDGAAHLEQFNTNGPSGHVQGMTYRLYRPESHQWYIYWTSRKDGILGLPAMVGEFKNGVGEFYDQEEFNGRMIYVRFIWSGITPNTAHFEQSFSDDGGETWEVNWITDQTRVK